MFKQFLHSRAAAFTLAGVLAVGALTGAGVAVAAGSGGGASPTVATDNTTQSSSPVTQNSSPNATPTMVTNQQCTQKPLKFRIIAGLIKDVASKSGIDAKTLVQDIKSGKSLNDILGSNAASVQQQVLADVQAKIQQAEQSGKLTSAQGQKLSQKAPDAISKFFSATHTNNGSAHHGKLGKLNLTRADLLKTAASTIGIDPTTLAKDIKSGQTIAQVAGGKTQAVITALQQQVDAAIQSAAQANNVPAAKVTAATNRANQRISNLVNNGFHHKAGDNSSGSGCK